MLQDQNLGEGRKVLLWRYDVRMVGVEVRHGIGTAAVRVCSLVNGMEMGTKC